MNKHKKDMEQKLELVITELGGRVVREDKEFSVELYAEYKTKFDDEHDEPSRVMCYYLSHGVATWDFFGWMWERMQAREGWEEFGKPHCYIGSFNYGGDISIELINPERFLTAVAEYLGWEE